MTTTTATTTNTTTTTSQQPVVVLLRARARAREAERQWLSEEDEKAIARYWKQVIGTNLPPAAHEDLVICAGVHMEHELIVEVIDQTASAPRPSWAYAHAIFNRLCCNAILTLDEYREDQRAWRERRKRPF